MKPRLTETTVRTLSLSKGSTEQIIFDSGKGSVPGLGLRVREGGSRKWIFQYRLAGKSRRQTIGSAAAWTLEAARKKARAMRVQVDQGIDPELEKDIKIEASKTIFLGVMKDYLEVRLRTMKPRSFAESKRHLENHWKPLHKLPIAVISRATVASRLREIAKGSGPVAADRARSTLSAMFAWAIGEGLCDSNAVTRTNKTSPDKERERTLTDAELAAVWKAAPDNQYGTILKLLVLTAARRDEIGSMRWTEIDMKAKLLRLPGERTKNGRAHDVPLSAIAMEIIESVGKREGRELVFGNGAGGYSGWSNSKELFDAKIEFTEPWTLHDLRRTVRTGLGRLGVAPHIAEAVLNHLPEKLVRTYDKNKYENEKRDALNRWASHVAVVTSDTSNVVPLRLR